MYTDLYFQIWFSIMPEQFVNPSAAPKLEYHMCHIINSHTCWHLSEFFILFHWLIALWVQLVLNRICHIQIFKTLIIFSQLNYVCIVSKYSWVFYKLRKTGKILQDLTSVSWYHWWRLKKKQVELCENDISLQGKRNSVWNKNTPYWLEVNTSNKG